MPSCARRASSRLRLRRSAFSSAASSLIADAFVLRTTLYSRSGRSLMKYLCLHSNHSVPSVRRGTHTHTDTCS